MFLASRYTRQILTLADRGRHVDHSFVKVAKFRSNDNAVNVSSIVHFGSNFNYTKCSPDFALADHTFEHSVFLRPIICSPKFIKIIGYTFRYACTSVHSDKCVDNEFIQTSPHADVFIPEDKTVVQYVSQNWHKFENHVALLDGITGKKWTYSELDHDIQCLASSLRRNGVRPRDIVSVISPNSPELCLSILALSAIGAVVSPVSPLYTADELFHSTNQAEAKFLLFSHSLLSVVLTATARCPAVQQIIVLDRLSVDDVLGKGKKILTIPQLIAEGAANSVHASSISCDGGELNAGEMAILPYSSGTTGLPKGVMLTHRNIVANIAQLDSAEGLGLAVGQECMLGFLPFFHIYGLVVLLFAGLRKGAKLVVYPKFEPKVFLEAVKDHRPTFLPIVPPMVLFLANHPDVDGYDFTSVHTFLSGAAPLSGDSVDRMLQRFRPHIPVFRQVYGLTELSPVSHLNPRSRSKHSSVGVSVQNCQFKVIDIETKRPLGPHTNGEVCVRGPNVMKGYFKNEKATSEMIDEDGWLHTGDIGFYDEEGYLTITDRLKELIKVKGYQVAPAELEAVLLTHGDVVDAAVIGVRDEKLGECPRAFVVLRAGAECSERDIAAFMKGRVASYKQLGGGIVFRAAISKSPSGKILRKLLREELKY